MAIIRSNHNKNNPYTMIINKTILDDRLSDSARGLLSRMLARPDDWQFYTDVLSKECKNKETSVRSSLKELQKFGYVKVNKPRSEKGKFAISNFYVYEDCDDSDYNENLEKELIYDE